MLFVVARLYVCITMGIPMPSAASTSIARLMRSRLTDGVERGGAAASGAFFTLGGKMGSPRRKKESYFPKPLLAEYRMSREPSMHVGWLLNCTTAPQHFSKRSLAAAASKGKSAAAPTFSSFDSPSFSVTVASALRTADASASIASRSDGLAHRGITKEAEGDI